MCSVIKCIIITGIGCLIAVIVIIGLIVNSFHINTDSKQCVTADNYLGKCMELNKCFPMIDDGSSIYVQNECSDDSTTAMVCCPKISPNIIDHPNHDLIPEKCGKSIGRIAGNTTSTLFQHPWMAIIMQSISGSVKEACAGTIINELYILTAAHCVTKLPQGITLDKVRVGDHDISSEFDCVGRGKDKICAAEPQEFMILEPIPHAYYNPETRQNDIALIRLDARIDFTISSSQPICLPTLESMETMNMDNQSLTVAGWGFTEYNYTSEVLLEDEVSVINNKRCAEIYKRSDRRISDKQICAEGREGDNTCNGDTGGPLMMLTRIYQTKVMVQYGIESMVSCGSEKTLGIYTKVAPYMKWILYNMKP